MPDSLPPIQVSVHDNFIVSYFVNATRREIILHTKFSNGNLHEYTDIIFRDVAGYRFEGDNLASILFDIVEASLDQFLSDNAAAFDEGIPRSWPGDWNQTPENRLEYLREHHSRAFQISSSLGLHGWVLAASMEKVLTHRSSFQ